MQRRKTKGLRQAGGTASPEADNELDRSGLVMELSFSDSDIIPADKIPGWETCKSHDSDGGSEGLSGGR